MNASQGCPIASPTASFDPFGEAYQLDPAQCLQWAREEAPVFYSPEMGYWVVTRYDDVKAVFRDYDTFSSAVTLEKFSPTVPAAQAVLKSYDYGMERTLVNEDEPTHMVRRRVLMDPFTPDRLSLHENTIRRLTREAVDAFVDEGRADLVSQMLYTVPLTVAMHFLGVPEEDMTHLKKYSVAHTLNTWGRPSPEHQLRVAEGVGEFWRYAGTVLNKIREDPSGDGWMQFSVRQQQEHPDVVTDSYLHSMMMAGIVAAHETTAYASANAVKYLLENRGAWEEICEDPALIPNAVEECLRYAGSIVAWRRITTRPTELGGVSIPADARVFIVQTTANRDPRHFEDGDAFDLRRTSASDHLSFGYGAHQCMGKNLARMEMQIFLQELTSRLPDLRLEEQEFDYVPNISFRGPQELWVSWDPAKNPERRDSSVLSRRTPVTVGEPSSAALSRTVTVEAADLAADRVLHLRLRDVRGVPLPRWTSGAHIDVECGVDADGEPVSRQYSLCGHPDADTYEIAVLEEEESRGGSRWLHANARAGGTLRIRGPRNHFRLDDAASQIVLITGGIGITPILAHADAAKAAGRDYHIHYAGRSRSHIAFLDRLERDHPGRVTTYLADEGRRMDLDALLADLAEGTQVYACGPLRLVDPLEQIGERWPDEMLHIEHFSSTLGELDSTKEHAFTLELRDSGLTLQVPNNQSVLRTLRGANIDIQADCEEGLCGSCEAVVLEGEVDHRDVVLTKSEREAGTRIMTCCSRARGDRLVLGL
jgi:cytochrome P450/ferredoxin-NADP reductase